MSTLFNDTKYSKWYFNIINTAQTKKPNDEYTEKHHIIPKSLGGNDKDDNLVILTARQHFICHLLLTKMTIGQAQYKMCFALNAFRRSSKTQQRILSSRQYSTIRKIVSKARSEMLKGNQYSLGKVKGPMSEATKEKIRQSKKMNPTIPWNKGKVGSMKGVLKTEATKQKMRKPKTKEHAENIRLAQLGKQVSVETRKKISQARLGKIYEKITCPHCSRLIDPGNFKKHHGDKCKSKH